MRSSLLTFLVTFLFASIPSYANSIHNLTQGVSPVSQDIYELHMLIFGICVVIGAIVFGAMFYSLYYHRKSRGAVASQFHHNTWLEITWTIIPIIILTLMAIPATKVLHSMDNKDKESLTIKVTGYQWKWHYEYLNEGISFFSNLATSDDEIHGRVPKTEGYLRDVDKPLVLPIYKKIRILITSNDVNHAWWVPDLGVKRDAIPGFINEAWTIINKPGTYYGKCAELCGMHHAYMPIAVVAKTEEDYKAWIAEQKGGSKLAEQQTNKKWTLEELMAQGEKVYNRTCATCHQPTGVGAPPTFPALKGSKIATGEVKNHVNTVWNGITGSAMQSFKGQLNDVDFAAVITYERNAWGNDTKTLVQPAQIKALRDGKEIDQALLVQPSGVAPAGAEPPKKDGTTATPTPATPAAKETSPVAPSTPSTASVASAPAASSEEAALKEAMVRGEKIYASHCSVCHQPTGLGMPPTFPALKGSKIATGPVAAHLQIVLNGKLGTSMQPFKDQLKDDELADVITYERNAWENNTKQLVKPADIAAARQQSK